VQSSSFYQSVSQLS